MFSAPSGARAMAKNTLAPHTKITIVMSSGMPDHAISRIRLPWMSAPISSAFRRRYSTEKNMIKPAMSSEKKVERPSRKKYSASTRPAMVDARSGKSGIPDHISTGAGCWVLGARCARATVASNHDQDERAEDEDGGRAGHTDCAHDG